MKKILSSFLSGVLASAILLTFFLPLVRATTVGIGLLETPDSIVITPNPGTIDVDDTQQFTATARFTCSPEPCVPSPDLDVTRDFLTTWSSDDAGIATVDNIDLKGLATGEDEGVTNIRATYGGVTGTAVIDVEGGGGGAARFAPPAFLPPPEPSEVPPATEETTEEVLPPPEEPPPEEPPPPEVPLEPTPEPPAPPPEPPPLPGPPPPGEEEFAPSPEGELPPLLSLPSEEGELPPGELPPGEPAPSAEAVEEGEAAPEVSPEEIGISGPPAPVPPPLTYQQLSPIFLPPELSVARGEILSLMIDKFDLENTKKELLAACTGNIRDCLSIFLSVTSYRDVVLDAKDIVGTLGDAKKVARILGFTVPPAYAAALFDLGRLQLYPDVPPEVPYSHAVNIGTLLGIVHGYYDETNSPFKPYQVITRIEAAKVLLGSVDLMKWLFYDELAATQGGADGVKLQNTPFADIYPGRDLMWWYPRYVNKACETGMIDCTPGTNFRPDEYVTDEEMITMIQKLKDFLDGSDYIAQQTGDPDNDTIKTYLEDTVYFTDPQNPDTDSDQLNDNEEIEEYRTSPFLQDTDAEGLSDYDEVKTYGTDPLKIDTDEDLYSDSEEIRFGSDPLDPVSIPADDNGTGVADSWEQQYQIEVKDGIQDTDGDGLSDKIEFQIGTNPLINDSDNDGFTDAEELLELHTDPANPDDPGTLESIGVRITNFQENQPVGDNTPLIKGVAPLGSTVRLVLRNDYGHEKILGDTQVDENNLFLFQVFEPIRDGKYILAAKALEPLKKKISVSDPVHILIDSTLNVNSPAPKKLSGQDVTEEVLLQKLRLEVRDRRPVLVGETEFGNRVTATWRSIVTTSALIADSIGGEFVIEAPRDMELGKHEVYVQATRKKDNAQSDTLKILFNVGVAFPGAEEALRGAAAAEAERKGLGVVFGAITDLAQKQGFLFWLIIAVVVVLAVAGVYYAALSRKKAKK